MTRKEIATSFLQLASSGRVREAFAAHAAPGFRHHNPYFAGDGATLLAGMEAAARQNPRQVLEVQRALQDGDLVAVHSRIRPDPSAPLVLAVVHLLRFEGERIAELWDVVQPAPAESPNAHGMF